MLAGPLLLQPPADAAARADALAPQAEASRCGLLRLPGKVKESPAKLQSWQFLPCT